MRRKSWGSRVFYFSTSSWSFSFSKLQLHIIVCVDDVNSNVTLFFYSFPSLCCVYGSCLVFYFLFLSLCFWLIMKEKKMMMMNLRMESREWLRQVFRFFEVCNLFDSLHDSYSCYWKQNHNLTSKTHAVCLMLLPASFLSVMSRNCSITTPCPENQECIITGSHVGFCICPKGFTLDGNGHCRDIDECHEMADTFDLCAENAECINLPGSYDCVCSAGYTGHPRESCTRICKYTWCYLLKKK